MEILELESLTEDYVSDLFVLMKELNSNISVTPELLWNVVLSANSHLFVAINSEGHIIGCASLCVFDSPTGQKASVEDVVVLSSCRGQHIGKALMEYLIEYAKRELKEVNLHLTSNPKRVAANELYKSLGFVKRDTNAFSMKIG